MMRSWKSLAAGCCIAAVHLTLFLSLFGTAYALSEGTPGRVPQWLSAVVNLLGAPLMLIPDTWFVALRSVFGSDTNSLFAVAGLNSVLWACGIVWLVHYLRARSLAWAVGVPAA
jgi:hypothetical protein